MFKTRKTFTGKNIPREGGAARDPAAWKTAPAAAFAELDGISLIRGLGIRGLG
jgi:hypothetical protein